MDYTINGVEYPSVTGKIVAIIEKPQLPQWAADCAVDFLEDISIYDGKSYLQNKWEFDKARTAYKDVSNVAMAVGTSVHTAIEKYLREGKTVGAGEHQQVKTAFGAFLKWHNEYKGRIKIIETEMTVFHPQLCYAGTFDLLCELDGVLTMVDYKTSKAIYDTHFVQVAGYLKARETISGVFNIVGRTGEYQIKLASMAKGSIKQIAILHLDKETGEFEFKIDKVPIWRRFKAFRGALDIFYNLKNTRRLKNNPRAKEG